MDQIESASTDSLKRRIYAVDFLRGVVMMIMLLDHTRDFLHAGALAGDPTNLTQTNVLLFFTRWITHFCAPTFVFLSGVSIYLQKMNGKTNAELSRFLLTRGLWLIFLEFTIVRFGVLFNVDYSMFGMPQVIWVIGISMIVMAGLIYLPLRAVGIAGLVLIVLHNVLDGITVPPNIRFGGPPAPDMWQTLWILLHQQGLVPLSESIKMFVVYPLIPWPGVMAAGYAFGVVYEWNDEKRRKFLLALGAAITVIFVGLRFINKYGDPAIWSLQDTPAFTFLSFINTTKYPPSLLFLLMTLGPSILVLALTDRIDGRAVWQRIGLVFGRVPMFFYILQWFTAHGLAIILSLLAGKQIGYLLVSPIEAGQLAPPDYGFSLGVVYAVWISGLVLLFPLCWWWGRLKQRNKHWALSYL